MKLFFRKYGDGPPLIILHGLYGSSDNWIHIARNIQHCYTVYLPDMRNHGHSPWSENHSYQDMSNDIVEFFGEQNLQQAFIAGHSMGGKTAIRFAVDNPGKVSGLFVGDISPFSYLSGSPADDQHKDILRIMTTVDPGNFNTREEVEAYLTTLPVKRQQGWSFQRIFLPMMENCAGGLMPNQLPIILINLLRVFHALLKKIFSQVCFL